VPVEDISRFETELLDHMRAKHKDILNEIRETKKLSDETADKLSEVVDHFKKGFGTSSGTSVVPDAHVEAMDEQDVEKESVRVRVPPPQN
jgi:F-type H+/Na+-transporting ATPase subunit alpha